MVFLEAHQRHTTLRLRIMHQPRTMLPLLTTSRRLNSPNTSLAPSNLDSQSSRGNRNSHLSLSNQRPRIRARNNNRRRHDRLSCDNNRKLPDGLRHYDSRRLPDRLQSSVHRKKPLDRPL